MRVATPCAEEPYGPCQTQNTVGVQDGYIPFSAERFQHEMKVDAATSAGFCTLAHLSRSEKQYRRKRIMPVLTIGKQSERFGQQLATPLSGEKKLIDDC